MPQDLRPDAHPDHARPHPALIGASLLLLLGGLSACGPTASGSRSVQPSDRASDTAGSDTADSETASAPDVVAPSDSAQPGDSTQPDSGETLADVGGPPGDIAPSEDVAPADDVAVDVGPPPPPSPGCGKAPLHAAGGVTVTIDAGPEGDGERNFYLSLPAGYDPNVGNRLYVGYAGTNWIGEQIQPYLDLEPGESNEIFVYPDPLWRDFEGWGNLGGWVLGPHAHPANGSQDLVFTEAILDYMEQNYCIDTERVFATGHSWGGDMAQVVACFLGERFTASIPIAANQPYWFTKSPGDFVTCSGETAVWTMFGINDTHFTWQSYPGEFGDLCRDFWLAERGCDGKEEYTALGIAGPAECREYTGCSAPTRYCLYGAEFGHQKPSYFSAAAMEWFRTF